MKRIAFVLLLTMASCEKEEPKPTTPAPIENEACKCGIVKSTFFSTTDFYWYSSVQNNCTANEKTFKSKGAQEPNSIYCTDKSW